MRLTYSYAFISRATPTSYPTELFLLMLPRQWFCLLKGKQTHILGATMATDVFVLIFVEYIHIALKMSNHYTYTGVISCADGRTQVQRLFISRFRHMRNMARISWVNTLRPRQSGSFTDDILKCIFLNENVWIPITISLTLVQLTVFQSFSNDCLVYLRIYASLGLSMS